MCSKTKVYQQIFHEKIVLYIFSSGSIVIVLIVGNTPENKYNMFRKIKLFNFS